MNTTFKYINKIPGLYLLLSVGRLIYYLVKYRSLKTILFSPPGHFYSPLPDLTQVKQQRNFFPLQDEDLPGIDLQTNYQLEILKKFSTYYQDLPFSENPEPDKRYYYTNGFFGYGDAIILYCFLRHFKPRQVIEIGSGFSSAVMLDTSERFLDYSAKYIFIDPHPTRLSKLLTMDESN